jgi:hypothetical protein
MNLSTVGSGRRELLSSETKVDQNGEVQGEQFWPQLYGAFQLSGLSTSAMYKISIWSSPSAVRHSRTLGMPIRPSLFDKSRSIENLLLRPLARNHAPHTKQDARSTIPDPL